VKNVTKDYWLKTRKTGVFVAIKNANLSLALIVVIRIPRVVARVRLSLWVISAKIKIPTTARRNPIVTEIQTNAPNLRPLKTKLSVSIVDGVRQESV